MDNVLALQELESETSPELRGGGGGASTMSIGCSVPIGAA
jgi:hypothetical protein